MDYPKHAWDQYPGIYLGPIAQNRIPQADLKAGNVAQINALLTVEEQLAWKERNHEIKVLKPSASAQLLPNDETHPGIAEPYQTRVGLKFSLAPGATRGGKLINDLFRPFGYRARLEGLDGDHLLEMQLGGPNELANLWPLDASENRSSGSLLSSMTFTPQGKPPITMEALKERARAAPGSIWIEIKTTL